MRRSAHAQPPPDDPGAFILRLRADVLAAGADGASDAARTALERVIREAFDFGAIAQSVLRNVAIPATADQRVRLARALARRMSDELVRRGGGADHGFRIAALREAAAGEWIVVSQVMPPDAPLTVLAWRVRLVDGRLRVIDVVRDGISAVIVQRDAISSAVAAGRSLDSVIDDIERRSGAARR